MYDEGLSHEGDLLDLASERGLVHQSGAWYADREDRIGQGRESAKKHLKEHSELAIALEQQLHIGVASRVFADLDTFIYARAQRDMQRRHPRTSDWWRTTKYWGQTRGPRWDRWVCMDQERHATLRKFAWTRMVRHRLVPTTYSAFLEKRRNNAQLGIISLMQSGGLCQVTGDRSPCRAPARLRSLAIIIRLVTRRSADLGP
jgi:Group II intron, maturase-specific domain